MELHGGAVDQECQGLLLLLLGMLQMIFLEGLVVHVAHPPSSTTDCCRVVHNRMPDNGDASACRRSIDLLDLEEFLQGLLLFP